MKGILSIFCVVLLFFAIFNYIIENQNEEEIEDTELLNIDMNIALDKTEARLGDNLTINFTITNNENKTFSSDLYYFKLYLTKKRGYDTSTYSIFNIYYLNDFSISSGESINFKIDWTIKTNKTISNDELTTGEYYVMLSMYNNNPLERITYVKSEKMFINCTN